MCAQEFAAMGLYAREYNTGSSKVAPNGSCEGNGLSRLSELMAATVCHRGHIQEEIYHCCYLYYSLGSSELDDRNAVGVVGKILGTLNISWLTREGGDWYGNCKVGKKLIEAMVERNYRSGIL